MSISEKGQHSILMMTTEANVSQKHHFYSIFGQGICLKAIHFSDSSLPQIINSARKKC
jgi:hypothetical protein